MRAHAEDWVLDIVARLIESETANSNTPCHEHDSVGLAIWWG
jgi:hypothetical protein